MKTYPEFTPFVPVVIGSCQSGHADIGYPLLYTGKFLFVQFCELFDVCFRGIKKYELGNFRIKAFEYRLLPVRGVVDNFG